MSTLQSQNFDEVRALYDGLYEKSKEILGDRIERGIEQHRKGDISLTVPAFAGKKVQIRQLNHAFKFGANLLLLDEVRKEDKEKFKELFKKHFNLATIPFYWNTLEPNEGKPRYAADSEYVYRRPAPDACMEFCKECGIDPKLHVLFYDKFAPQWLRDCDEETCLEKLEQRFREIAERYAGKMFEVEVTNELFCVNDRKTVLGKKRNIAEHCFALAKKYFPTDRLTINESTSNTQFEKDNYSPYYMFCDKLIHTGVPVDRIGIQRHQFTGVRALNQEEYDGSVLEGLHHQDIAAQLNALDILAELGKPLEITEVTLPCFTTDIRGEELQADLLERIYTAWFSHPAVDAIVYWNTADGYAFEEPGRNENNCRGGLFHKDLTPKKAAERLYYLINEKWHTELEMDADEEGTLQFRGFYGDYIAECDGTVYEFSIKKDDTK